MKLMYHRCGHPIYVQENQEGEWWFLTLLDVATDPPVTERVFTCPGCGKAFRENDVRDRP
jgi:hypothetical protein